MESCLVFCERHDAGWNLQQLSRCGTKRACKATELGQASCPPVVRSLAQAFECPAMGLAREQLIAVDEAHQGAGLATQG